MRTQSMRRIESHRDVLVHALGAPPSDSASIGPGIALGTVGGMTNGNTTSLSVVLENGLRSRSINGRSRSLTNLFTQSGIATSPVIQVASYSIYILSVVLLTSTVVLVIVSLLVELLLSFFGFYPGVIFITSPLIYTVHDIFLLMHS